MNRPSRRAFTLVELLVVIGIIGMLVALLMPALGAAKEHARQIRCGANLHNLSLAVIGYTQAKNRYPGWATTITQYNTSTSPATVTTVNVGWLPQIFEYIDKKQAAVDLRAGTVVNGAQKYLSSFDINTGDGTTYALLSCPSDPTDPTAQLSTTAACGSATNTATIHFPLSYACNAGQPDAGTDPRDDPRFALFMDQRSNVQKITVAQSDVTDGLAQTLMFTENIDQTEWTQVTEMGQGVTFYGTWNSSTNTWGDVALSVALNDLTQLIAPVDCNSDGIIDNLDYPHARPSSYHQEGVNIAYCDGHVDFFYIDNTATNGTTTGGPTSLTTALGMYPIYRSKMTPGAGD